MEPTFTERGLVQQQEAVDQEGVVFKVSVQLGLPVLVRAQQATGLVHELIEQEPAARLGYIAIVVTVEDDRRLGKGGEHESIP